VVNVERRSWKRSGSTFAPFSKRTARGVVVQAAKERAREHLRKGARFVWNATNLNRQRRGPIVQMAADYSARVRIVYVEVPRAALFEQNRARAGAVPWPVILRMSERWEVPSLVEAHDVTLTVGS
jgi:predicted kinase